MNTPKKLTGYYYEDLEDLTRIPDDSIWFCCSDNALEELPILSNLLKLLYCSGNYISELPVLPYELEALFCDFNNITELQELPNTLKKIDCSCNKIKFITPDMYTIMKNIYFNLDYHSNQYYIDITRNIFYDQSGCSSEAQFFGYEGDKY